MGELFCGKGIESFFEIIQRPVRSNEELLGNVRQAVSCIQDVMHIGKVTLNLSVPQSKLRAQIDNLTSVLYQGEEVASYEPVACSFRTGDGGTVVVTFYAVEWYAWNESELREIRILGSQIFGAFRQEMMEGLIRRAMTMDLAVSIPNISGFMEFASQMYARGSIEQYDAVYFNIHNFKYVNKVLPHLQADEVMKIYAGMVMRVLESDEIAARLGGDNFVALVRKENAEKFIKFISNVDITYQYEDEIKKFNFGATIGAGHLDHMNNVGELMLRISVAYQFARQHEGSGVVYYNDEIYKEIMQQKEVIAGFYQALKNREFVVYYQPKVCTRDKRLCGGEALVRWQSWDGKLIPPAQFIPILEKEGSICKLDFYVLDSVCEMLSRCRREGTPLTRISVNFSRRHMENKDLVQEIITTIDRYRVPHEFIEIELTESEDFRDYIVMARLINALKAEGISTSIDDFGTGYSSLNMLKMTSIDLLKIDKSFIPCEEDYADKRKDCIMFEGIARLAKELGFQMIAEGVETQQQYDYLTSVGCDMIQGFYFDKPLPEDVFLEKVRIGKY